MVEQYVSRKKLRRLLSALLAAGGAIALFTLFAFIVVPGLRNANKPPAPPPVASPQLETGWLDPTGHSPARGNVLHPIDPKTVLHPNPELLARGKVLYQENCPVCHGDSGKGDGPAAKALRPAPRNFTEATGWVNGYTLTRIYKTLTHGVPKSAMPSFAHLRVKDRMALVHYVQSLGTFAHGPDDPAAVAALAAEFAEH